MSILRSLYTALLWGLALARAHPSISGPLVGSLVTLVFKPRSPEAYSRLAARHPVWFFSRVAPLLQLIGALFPDTQKASKVIVKVITGKQDGEA